MHIQLLLSKDIFKTGELTDLNTQTHMHIHIHAHTRTQTHTQNTTFIT